jgi:hypothetical protein
MKRIEDLSKSEKVAFLKDISTNKIDVKALGGRPPLFLCTKFDVWIYISQPRTQVGIAITEEAREALAILNEIIKNQS